MKKQNISFQKEKYSLFSLDFWCYLHNIPEDLFFGDLPETKRFNRCSRASPFHIFEILGILAVPQKNRPIQQNFSAYQSLSGPQQLCKIFFKGKIFLNKFKNMQYSSIHYFFPTCLTNTFFITTIGESAGKELLVVTGRGQGPSSVFQHNAFSTSSESVCSITLRHSELPSARCRVQLLVVSHAVCLLPPFSSTILLPFNPATKNNKV